MTFTSIILLAVALVDVAAMVLVTVLAAMAFFHALTVKPIQFERAFKRTRTFWLLVTGACLLFTALMSVPAVIALLTGGIPQLGGMFVLLIAATASGVYLADVKPAVNVESSGPSAW
ncbi:DUF2516 family protein [Kocuria palustris]|uniref:DUF2516 family protein n=1 Tax=Kocuria palustris TaxID=71999 RepID=UPI00119CA7B0|nr:DUF2516 family protein [Kocuria palustris]